MLQLILKLLLKFGCHQVIAAALRDAPRPKGMSQIAREASLNRESLDKTLSAASDPKIATLSKVISVPGVAIACQCY
jgi:probable addiction module antidote protein